MMYVGHCTQRKPQLCGDPCLVVTFVSKLLAHQIYLWFKVVEVNTKAPWCNGSKERSDCKKTHGTRLIILQAWPSTRRTSRRFLQQPRISPLSLLTGTRAFWGTFSIRCDTFQHHCGYLAWHNWITQVHNSWKQLILRYVLLLSSTDSAISKLLKTGSYVMYTLIVEFSHTNNAYPRWNKVYLMPDGSVLVLVMFPLFWWFFLAYQSWGKPFVFHTSNHNLVISLEINQKNMCW